MKRPGGKGVAALSVPAGTVPYMPRIGCGLAGGTWPRVEPLVENRLVRRGIPVTVYDHD